MARRRALLAVLALMLPLPAVADFAALSEAELAEQSALIAAGTYLGAQLIRPLPGADPLHLGVLQLSRVIKGDASRRLALLRLPPPRPPGLRASADVVLEPGQTGLWYLRGGDDGLFEIDRPDRFVPSDRAAARIRALTGH